MSVSEKDLKRLIKEAISEVQKEEHVHTPSRAEIVEGNANIICNEPECYSAVVKKAKKFKYKCSDCGLPLPESMVKAEPFEKNPMPCPSCGSMEAEEREVEEDE